MPKDFIEIAGARENNLKNVSLRIPKRKLTVFTGVSGSGKSSLVFDTIAAEAQRQLNETFTSFVRNRLPRYGQPDVDAIDNLSAAIVINQKRIGGNSRSTVGTITDISSLLRLLFARAGTPFVGYSNAFSFNDVQGMCPECEGLGQIATLDLEKFLDRSKSLNEGAIRHPSFRPGTWYWRAYTTTGLFDNDKKLKDFTKQEWNALLHGAEATIKWRSAGGPGVSRYEGLLERFSRIFLKKDVQAMSENMREVFERFVTQTTCRKCKGSRLNQKTLSCRIDGYNIADLSAMQANDLVRVLETFHTPVAAPVLESLRERLRHLVSIGLGYLSLDRPTTTLSGGESQRIKMVRHLSSSLTEMIYVFDEPSVGLHARDVQRLNALLLALRDKGNTILVVEHDRDVIAIADHIVDIGPRAGADGGEVVFQGSFAKLRRARTLTARAMTHELPLKTSLREPAGWMRIANASLHNLKNVTVDIPAGVLTVVTGVAGSGKSTLINDVFAVQHPEAIVIDQSAVSTSIRSNPATYTGMLDDIRQLFAQANNVSASLFSANSEGACPGCEGLGIVYTDLLFMDGLKSICEVCRGKRFKEDVLRHTLRGRSISDLLDMTAREALQFFTDSTALSERLDADGSPTGRAITGDLSTTRTKTVNAQTSGVNTRSARTSSARTSGTRRSSARTSAKASGVKAATLETGRVSTGRAEASSANASRSEQKLRTILRAMIDVGLDYLTLGQPLSTLSGGESQRIKLATELHKSGAIYVMDEPTTGLHLSDIGQLLGIIERLVRAGSSVIVIEHNLDVIKQADWIIDLGPEGGHDGGEVLFEGRPRDLLACRHSVTAEHLRRHAGID